MMSFTGSTRAGVLVAQAAAPTVKRVAQELGGKSPNIILPTADLEKAVGGGVMHFIDDKSDLARVWEIEFEKVNGEKAPTSAGLIRIDHVAQTMKATGW